MTDNQRITLEFIDKTLEWSDNKVIALELGVSESIVSRVRRGKETSKRILSALEDKAIQHKMHAIKISQYSKTDTNI